VPWNFAPGIVVPGEELSALEGITGKEGPGDLANSAEP